MSVVGACTARKVTGIINTRVQGGFSRIADILSMAGGWGGVPPWGGPPRGAPLGGTPPPPLIKDISKLLTPMKLNGEPGLVPRKKAFFDPRFGYPPFWPFLTIFGGTPQKPEK